MISDKQTEKLLNIHDYSVIILGNSQQKCSIFLQHDDNNCLYKLQGLDLNETLFDLLIKFCKYLHWNPSAYALLVPELSIIKTHIWKILPLTTRINKWTGCISFLKFQFCNDVDFNSNDIFIKVVLKIDVQKYIERSICLSTKFSSPAQCVTSLKTGRDYLKDLGTRILITLPGNIITVVREKDETSVFTIVQKVCKYKCFDISKLSVFNPKTGYLLDPNMSFNAQGVVEMELKFCVPSNLVSSSSEVSKTESSFNSPTIEHPCLSVSETCNISNSVTLSKPIKRRAPPPPPKLPIPAKDYPVSLPDRPDCPAESLEFNRQSSSCLNDVNDEANFHSLNADSEKPSLFSFSSIPDYNTIGFQFANRKDDDDSRHRWSDRFWSRTSTQTFLVAENSNISRSLSNKKIPNSSNKNSPCEP